MYNFALQEAKSEKLFGSFLISRYVGAWLKHTHTFINRDEAKVVPIKLLERARVSHCNKTRGEYRGRAELKRRSTISTETEIERDREINKQ